MGPTALFDKSFLQSLSVDESVWFDNFFVANICPLFYFETLADLQKKKRLRRSPEDEVRLLVQKFPEMAGVTNVWHGTLHYLNLVGYPIPMTGQIFLPRGESVRASGYRAIVCGSSPEEEAFQRWLRGEFQEVERWCARLWRAWFAAADFKAVAREFALTGVAAGPCSTLEDVKRCSIDAIRSESNPVPVMKMAILWSGASEAAQRELWSRWTNAGCPALPQYAPYAAYVTTVEVFFQMALNARLIAPERASNRVDISYLFYLPFCTVFVSSDKLHRKCAPLFMRDNQAFVWGNDLKRDLHALNDYYGRFDEETKQKGVMSFAGVPPKDGDFLVSRLWDRFRPGWRERRQSEAPVAPPRSPSGEYLEELRKAKAARPPSRHDIDFQPEEADIISVKHLIRKKKGSWWQVPKDLADQRDAYRAFGGELR